MSARTWIAAAIVAAAAQCFPLVEHLSAQHATGVMISEFRFRGARGQNDEFIEIYNGGPADVNIGGWLIRASNSAGTSASRVTITAGTILKRGCFYLVANTSSTGGYNGPVAPNQTYTTQFADDGGVALLRTLAEIVDQAGHSVNGYREGDPLPVLTADVNRGIERRPGGIAGHVDTNNNLADFHEITPGNPQNAGSDCITEAVRLPHDVQGTGAASPLAGSEATVRGVVTALTVNGFFMQTNPGDEDTDAATSEGLFVFTGVTVPAAAQVGRLLHVTGTVAELGARTQLTAVSSVTDVGAATLPAPYALTAAELSATGSLDQLERFEGMLVAAESLTAVSGSDAGAAFFAVLTGVQRTFREPGISAGAPMLACAAGPCHIAVFDANPERLRVDSDGLSGVPPVDVRTGAVMEPVSGPLDFASGAYTLLPETMLAPTDGMTITAAPAAAPGQFSVASLHLDRFGNAADEARLQKASQMIHDVLGMPDIVGVQDVSVAALEALAGRVGYTAYAAAGTNADGFTVGALVNDRVAVTSSDTVGLDVNDRGWLVLRAQVSGPSTLLPQQVTVVISQFLPAAGAERDDASGLLVRTMRQAQADFLANFIQGRQVNSPAEAIVALGDYHTVQFIDGYTDVLGTVLGVPAPPDQVAVASPDAVSPDLVDAGAGLPAHEQYSLVVDGNAQALDHLLMTANLTDRFVGLSRPRVNADFPESWRADAATPGRLSHRDPLVAYFTFPPDLEPPTFDFAPQNQSAEATSPDGAAVDYLVPVATDNLDPDVAVSCVPASGTTFPIGNTGVTCSATDDSGNTSEVAFTVSVTEPTAGRLRGAGSIVGGDTRVWFALDVREMPLYSERGWIQLMVKGSGKPSQFVSSSVDSVAFSQDGETVTFTATGSWNGVGGYTLAATTRDVAEPGRDADTFSVMVKAPTGQILIGMSGALRDGNLQSRK